MKFPKVVQKSIDRYVKKEVRKHRCLWDSNTVECFHRKNNPHEGDLKKYHSALSRVYDGMSKMYSKFEDWENYNKYLNLSVEEMKKSVEYSCKIWEEAFSR